MNKYTNQQIASDYCLWVEYFDTDAVMTEAEFDDMTLESRIEMIEQAFGE